MLSDGNPLEYQCKSTLFVVDGAAISNNVVGSFRIRNQEAFTVIRCEKSTLDDIASMTVLKGQQQRPHCMDQELPMEQFDTLLNWKKTDWD